MGIHENHKRRHDKLKERYPGHTTEIQSIRSTTMLNTFNTLLSTFILMGVLKRPSIPRAPLLAFCASVYASVHFGLDSGKLLLK